MPLADQLFCQCGKPKRSDRVYCSSRCYWEDLKGKSKPRNARPEIEKHCQVCGKSFSVQYKKRKRKFCSRACYMTLAPSFLISFNKGPIPASTRRLRSLAGKRASSSELQRTRASEFCKSRIGTLSPLFEKSWVQIPNSNRRIVCENSDIATAVKKYLKLSLHCRSLKRKRRLPYPPPISVLRCLRFNNRFSLRKIGSIFGVCHHTVKGWFIELNQDSGKTLPWNKGKVLSDEWVLNSVKGAKASRLKQSSHSMTSPEAKLLSVIEKYKLPFIYTGDGSFWIENLNPDFVNCNGLKLCIEVFGNYWHSYSVVKKKKEQMRIIVRNY